MDASFTLRARVAALTRELDDARAALADADMRERISKPREFCGLSRAELETQYARRASRRAWERTEFERPIRPGPWDVDLDMHHTEHVFELADGYTGIVARGGAAQWNGYLVLPRGHPLEGVDGDTLTATAEISCEITFAGPDAARGGRWCVGFDHAHGHDHVPVPSYSPFVFSAHRCYTTDSPGASYTTRDEAVEEVKRMRDDVCARVAAIAADAAVKAATVDAQGAVAATNESRPLRRRRRRRGGRRNRGGGGMAHAASFTSKQ